MIPRIWTEAPFSHQGKYFEVPPRHVLPHPVQEPHPPLYVAATRDETLDVAGRLGIGALCLGFGGPEDILRKRIRYDRAIAARGDGPIAGLVPTHHLSALCPAVVLEDRELARAIGVRGQRFFVDALNHAYAGAEEPRSDVDLTQAAQARLSQEVVEADLASPGNDPAAAGIRRAFGGVEDATAYVRALQEAGADEVMFLIQMGTVPQSACLETIRLLGERVLPQFR